MKKAAAILLFASFAATAVAFPASLQVEDRTATPNNPAEFILEVENQMGEQQNFRITSLSSPPATQGWFSYPYMNSVDGFENGTFQINVYSSEYAVQQNYRFKLNVKASKTGESKVLENYFSVDSGRNLHIYSAGLSRQTYQPGEEITGEIVLANTASSALQDYNVTAEVFGEEKVKRGEFIPSGSRREYSFNFRVPEDASPGQKTFQMSVQSENGETVGRNFDVAKVSEIRVWENSSDRIFSNSRTVKAENTGNSPENVTLNHTVESYFEPLTTFSREPHSKEQADSGTTYYWTESLSPGETFQVERNTDYWPPLVALGFLVLGLAAIERLYVGLKTDKTAKKVADGIKVRLEIVNRSRHEVENVKIEDFVPDIANVDRDFPMAAPEVAKTGEGTRLTWNLGSMNPGEQRVMEYLVKPSVKVEGGVILPAAEISVDGEKLADTGKVEVEFDPANHE